MLFTIFEICILVGLLQVLFLLFSLKKIKNRSRYFDKYLLYFLVLNAIMLAGIIRFSFPDLNKFEHWFRGLDLLEFLYGPLVYAIFKQSTSGAGYKLEKWHFYPVFLGIILLLILNLIIVNSPNLVSIFELRGIYSAAVCIIYWVAANIHLFRFFEKNNKQTGIELVQKRFLIALSLSIFPFAVLWFGSIFLQKIDIGEYGIFNFNMVLVALCIPTYVVGYFIIVYPKITRKELHNISTSLAPLLNTSEIRSLRKIIEDKMKQKKPFLNPKLTLNQLALEMDVTPNKLSWYLNNELNTSFYNFINQFRIEEFKSLVENKAHKTHTIFALAIDSGFNSKSTFNKIFKQLSGQTPSEFVKRQEAEN